VLIAIVVLQTLHFLSDVGFLALKLLERKKIQRNTRCLLSTLFCINLVKLEVPLSISSD
jgi:hypothetical protein